MTYRGSKYFLTSDKKRIKYYFLNNNSQTTVVFFHGFMSNMVGEKPSQIQKFCKRRKINFLKFEYSGHGKSSGKFTEGNISKWTNQSKQLINLKNKNKNLIFVGSSMGSWIALNLIKLFKNQVKGFIGIASAPEFLQKLMWDKFSNKIKQIIIKKKIYYLDHGGFNYPLTKQLIFDGKKNKILKKNIDLKIPIVLFHGLKDKVVPTRFSKKILNYFKGKNKKLIKIKNGDHSLSRKSDLKKICRALNFMISNHL